jgi:hypothetical protein
MAAKVTFCGHPSAADPVVAVPLGTISLVSLVWLGRFVVATVA